MSILDIFLLWLWLLAWLGGYFSWADSLYKFFLGLITGFLMYLVVYYQILALDCVNPRNFDSYQNFLAKYKTSLLSLLLLLTPLLGMIFMLNPRLKFQTKTKSISQILLWLLLPTFLVWLLAFLSKGSILSESETWRKIFDYFSGSGLYKTFESLPWAIFLLLLFLIFYKSLFILLYSFFLWIYREVFLGFFRSWNEEKKLRNAAKHEEEDFEE
jgi:hypothetical protein